MIGFEVGLRTVNDFEAVELAFSDDVQSVALLAFYDNILIGRGLNILHGINDNSDIFFVEAAEENAFFDECLDDLLGFWFFGHHLGNPFCLFVELPEDFCTDALATVLLLELFLLFFFEFAEELCLLFFSILI